MRIIADLVMNHTSDQHPWFQASRSDPDGPFGDFYVWSDTDDRYPDARIIFIDTEKSNWTWDAVRGQYYWHRFFSHQPDLNFDSIAVQDAMLEVLRFWLDIGIDGFRLDAVPYLFVRDGTNGENLPRPTSTCVGYARRSTRATPTRCCSPRPTSGRATWSNTSATTNPAATECHMAFHFPLMPRIFHGGATRIALPHLRNHGADAEDPVQRAVGIFLRNHDELTLEMVTDEERDYMYSEYAKDPRMKANVGIRRRLAPLLDNSRDQMELFTSLLLSLPGSPVIYYGDEIGMGDNVYLGDRDGVRPRCSGLPTAMRAFPPCDPARLYLPVLMDAVYGYQAVKRRSGDAAVEFAALVDEEDDRDS